MAGQPAGRLPEVCAEQSSSGHGKFGACRGSAGVSGSAESLVLLCSRLLHLQMELDVSSASTSKDARVRRGWGGSASQGCAGWKRAARLPCGVLWGSTRRPRAQTWGKRDTEGNFAPLRCGCDVGRACEEPGSQGKREASNAYVCVDCTGAEPSDPPALPKRWGLGHPREMGNNQWIQTGGTRQDRAWAGGCHLSASLLCFE